ncbi:IS3 family transposase [Bacillus pseudomycoides]|uniref:IS3 family transposase n=1 Tax=Bacillus pseudomycoides TaxID=64104 RepID=UPI003D21CCCA
MLPTVLDYAVRTVFFVLQTFQSLQLVIEKYMQDYNYDRYQSTLKKMAPVQYRNHLLSA